MPRPQQPPSYLRRGEYARTKFHGRYVSLGIYNSDESHQRFKEIRSQWQAEQATGTSSGSALGLTVAGLAAAWLRHVEQQGLYRRADGSPTSEIASWHLSLSPLLRLYGNELAKEFSPRKLKTVRQAMLDGSWLSDEERQGRLAEARETTCSRKTTNQRVGRLVRLFAFGVGEELIPVEVHAALEHVDPLPARAGTQEWTTGPVSDQDIRDTLPCLPDVPRAIALLQLATGMRPGEVVAMERGDIDTVGLMIEGTAVWVYRPGGGSRHKTAHHGITRQIPLGPAAQLVLRPFLDGAGRWLFAGRSRKGKEIPYRIDTYAHQVLAAARQAGVPDWAPNRLRKSAATDIEERMDLDTARATLGHTSAGTTKTFYAKADLKKAAKGAAKLG